MYSLRYNLPWYLLYLGIFGIFSWVFCLTAWGKSFTGGSFQGLLGVLIGLNRTFSLLWLALVIGYGIVKIPINCRKNSNMQCQLSYVRCKVAQCEDELIKVVAERSQNLQQLIFCLKDIQVKPEHVQYKAIVLKNVEYALAKADEKTLG